MYPPRTLARLLARNIRRSGTPLGIPASRINTWWSKSEKERQEGRAMLFTGLMYQMMPYIRKLTQIMHGFEGKRVENLLLTLSNFSGSFSTFSYLAGFSKGGRQYFNGILRKISELLTASDIDFFYNPEFDFYSGILLYEVGDDRSFAEHASLVAEALREQGIRKIITVDPHTTYALKILYPQFTGVSFEVKSYLEVLRGEMQNEGLENLKIAFHDPCYYTRHLEMTEVLRKVMRDFRIECTPMRNSGRLTSCCGGPVESFSAKLSLEISRIRYMELKETGCDVVTACPICLGNFMGLGKVRDLAEVLWARRIPNERS